MPGRGVVCPEPRGRRVRTDAERTRGQTPRRQLNDRSRHFPYLRVARSSPSNEEPPPCRHRAGARHWRGAGPTGARIPPLAAHGTPRRPAGIGPAAVGVPAAAGAVDAGGGAFRAEDGFSLGGRLGQLEAVAGVVGGLGGRWYYDHEGPGVVMVQLIGADDDHRPPRMRLAEWKPRRQRKALVVYPVDAPTDDGRLRRRRSPFAAEPAATAHAGEAEGAGGAWCPGDGTRPSTGEPAARPREDPRGSGARRPRAAQRGSHEAGRTLRRSGWRSSPR